MKYLTDPRKRKYVERYGFCDLLENLETNIVNN